MTYVVQLKNIGISFGSSVVIDDFDLKIMKNEKILLFGDSGVGKSTIVKMLLGFVKPDKGCVQVFSENVNEQNIWNIRSKISYVSQDVDIGEGQVSEILDEIFSLKSNKEHSFDKSLLPKFNLTKKVLEKQIGSLSLGEKQRLMICIALSLNRELYILDEITSGLDKKMKEKIVDVFGALDKTVIAISHDEAWQKNFKIIPIKGNSVSNRMAKMKMTEGGDSE